MLEGLGIFFFTLFLFKRRALHEYMATNWISKLKSCFFRIKGLIIAKYIKSKSFKEFKGYTKYNYSKATCKSRWVKFARCLPILAPGSIVGLVHSFDPSICGIHSLSNKNHIKLQSKTQKENIAMRRRIMLPVVYLWSIV